MTDIEELRPIVAKWQPWGDDDNVDAVQPLRSRSTDRHLAVAVVLSAFLFLAALVNAAFSRVN